MSLWNARGRSGMGFSFSSTGATRIAGAWGTTVTPAQNAKTGAWAQVLTAANVSQDVFGLFINFNSNASSTNARDTICDIGVDSAGGTTYQVLIPNLLASSAGAMINIASGCGINYFFPIWIKAGSTVACRASINNATVGTLACRMRIFGAPKDRRNILVGTRVVAVGVTTATSSGTSVTPGTAAEGSWTQLGTLAATDQPWFWQYGVGVNNGTITAVSYSADLGIGSAAAKNVVSDDRVWGGTTAETWADNGCDMFGFYQAAGGDIVYGRMQASGTAISGLSMAAYGVV